MNGFHTRGVDHRLNSNIIIIIIVVKSMVWTYKKNTGNSMEDHVNHT